MIRNENGDLEVRLPYGSRQLVPEMREVSITILAAELKAALAEAGKVMIEREDAAHAARCLQRSIFKGAAQRIEAALKEAE